MYVGHFAAGLAIKSTSPKTPLWAILIAVGLIDYLFSIFVILEIEKISEGKFLFIDWSHSLIMSIIWSFLFGSLFYKKGKEVSIILAISVFSHFILDVFSHQADLAIYPYSTFHWGLATYELGLKWWVELLISAFFMFFYLQIQEKRKNINIYSITICAFLLAVHMLRSLLGL